MVRPGDQVDRDELVAASGRRRVPARVPGGGARRGGGARLDRRRVPVDRRPSRAHRPLGRRGRPPLGVRGRRPALDPRRRRGVRSSRPASCSRPTRCASGRPSCCATQPWGREQWERLADGQVFDGMESWLPWLTEREHLLTDLLPDTALALLVEPKRMRDRAQELLDEEASLAATLAVTWGAGGDARPAAALARVRPPARAHRAPARCRCSSTPEGPDTPRLAATAFDPVVGDADALARRLRALAGEGYRVVLAAEGTGSAQRLRDVLAGEGARRGRRRADARRGAARGRAARARRGAAGRAARARRRSRPHRPPARAPPRPRRAARASTTTTRSSPATTSCTTSTASAATSR